MNERTEHFADIKRVVLTSFYNFLFLLDPLSSSLWGPSSVAAITNPFLWMGHRCRRCEPVPVLLDGTLLRPLRSCVQQIHQ